MKGGATRKGGAATIGSAHAIALLALFVALGGTAIALSKNSVKSRHIANGSVKSADLKDDGVKSKDLKNDNVKSVDLANGGVALADLDPDLQPMWAFVGSDGTLAGGAGVESTAKDESGAGFYYVTFDRTITDRAFSVTAVPSSIGQTMTNARFCLDEAPLGSDNCAAGRINDRTLFVNTENASGANADSPFVVRISPPSQEFAQPAAGARAPRPAKGPGPREP